MKSKEELNAMKEEAETLGAKLAELNEDELAEVSGGVFKDNVFITKSFDPLSHFDE